MLRYVVEQPYLGRGLASRRRLGFTVSLALQALLHALFLARPAVGPESASAVGVG